MAKVADPCGGPGECEGLGRSDGPLVLVCLACACERMGADNVLQVTVSGCPVCAELSWQVYASRASRARLAWQQKV